MKKVKSILLIAAGLLLLAIGAVGLFVPVWPTTPFVLLAVACLSVAPKLRARLMRINFFREHVENYRSRQGLSRRTVVISLVYLWALLILSILLTSQLWLLCLLLAIGTAVTVHILLMASPKPRGKQLSKKTGVN